MQVAEIFRRYLGWCPMAAAAQKRKDGGRPEIPQAEADGAGPVARREALFQRFTFAVACLAWIAAVAALPYLPEVIPVHWNIYGEPDGFAGRITGAFGLPVIITATALLLRILPRFDRMKTAFSGSRDIYTVISLAVISLMFGIEVAALLSAAGSGIPMAFVLPFLLGGFFIVLGSLMPYIPRNTTMGIRLPWTIRSERVWIETHRHGGNVFTGAGVLTVIFGAAGAWAVPLAMGTMIAAVLYITVWSYRLAREAPPYPDP
jgi:uncharacterized membrane protein